MKIPEQEKSELMEGLLELLDHEAIETKEEIIKDTGRNMINFYGIYKTKDGDPVKLDDFYTIKSTTRQKVNHRQKIGHIIADAANMAEMEDGLARHLAKYAKDPAAVVQSIPVRYLMQNKERGAN